MQQFQGDVKIQRVTLHSCNLFLIFQRNISTYTSEPKCKFNNNRDSRQFMLILHLFFEISYSIFSKSASKETDRADRSSSSRPGSSMSVEEEEMANERRASLRARPAQQNPPPPKRSTTKRAASDKDKAGQAKRVKKEADTQLIEADTEQMDPLSILAEAAQRVDKRGE